MNKEQEHEDHVADFSPCTDPVYLIVADESDEFSASLLYVGRVAKPHGA